MSSNEKYFLIFKLTKICVIIETFRQKISIIIEMTSTNSHGVNADSKVICHC